MIDRFTKQSYIENGYVTASRKRVNYNCSRHWHEFFEIEYIIDGDGEYEIDGELYKVKPGMLFFITPVDFHSLKTDGVELFNIMFSGSFCNRTILSRLTSEFTQHAIEIYEKKRDFFECLIQELTENISDIEYSSVLLDSILGKLSKIFVRNSDNKLSVSQKAQLFILNNFRNNIGLKEVSANVGLSSAYFCEVFKKETGENFKDYINSLRMEYAKKLIEFSDMSITEVCDESGFNDYANFIRRFKVYTGDAPNKYRNKKWQKAIDKS